MLSNFKNQQISKLDASMVRCGITFIFAYRFSGSIDPDLLEESVNTLLSQVPRLQKKMVLLEKYRGQWQTPNFIKPLFSIDDNAVLDEVLSMAYQNVGMTSEDPKVPPMHFTLCLEPTQPTQFIILQTGKHSYCDGKSATMMFNHVITFYNALLTDDKQAQQTTIDAVSALTSPTPDDVFALRKQTQPIIEISRWQHIKNIARLMTYKVSDKAQHSTSHKQLPNQFKQFQQTSATPLVQRFDMSSLIDYANQHCPDVSPNNLICALIAKATYAVNRKFKNQPTAYQISFRMMIDIFNAPMRKRFIGNYIAYLPVTVDARMPLMSIADRINDRLFNARLKREDISMYKLLEFALGSGMANKTNDPVSYIIANIDNITLNHNPTLMQGATYLKTDVTANSVPQDLGGAQLNNRPTLCFNLSKENLLMISFFNTVTNPLAGQQLLESVAAELDSLDLTDAESVTVAHI
ncbi:hypothetical protein Q7C_395 [Methylophaga frappieri]|uniref:Condensation domain-containing protein n=1 Tax=Methylophaga frappieri (strain ATCC BAA-2434 / DSM 25690 / JAM7) TaxID=754477 RepID=I1YF77_METFJ|nr:hypothetical protein [Methylophaga frappieri]AFJ01570.1 hypothetical protein Q7C_395 [Methylophaga frappieri]